jgi:hypothetical protein
MQILGWSPPSGPFPRGSRGVEVVNSKRWPLLHHYHCDTGIGFWGSPLRSKWSESRPQCRFDTTLC